MNEYTAEDFANARFAANLDGRRAIRMDGGHWRTSNAELYPHVALAEETGWRPVVEVEDPEAIVALIGMQATRIRDLEGEREPAPLTLGTLREAWENAEVPTEANPVREGDEVIRAIDLRARGAFEVSIAESWLTGAWSGREGSGLRVRILSRAPQPEPWQALADGIEAFGWEIDSDNPKALAKYLHSKGVRVTGGDES